MKLTVVIPEGIDKRDVPIDALLAIFAVWKRLSTIIKKKAKLIPGCTLSWILTLREEDGKWHADSQVGVVFRARGKERDTYVEVPIIQVDNINFYQDGTWFWRGLYSSTKAQS